MSIEIKNRENMSPSDCSAPWCEWCLSQQKRGTHTVKKVAALLHFKVLGVQLGF